MLHFIHGQQELSSYWDGRPFGHNRHGSKNGELLCPFPWGQLGPHLTQCRLGLGLPPYMKWHLNPSGRLAATDMGQKLGVVPLLGELDSHLTQCGLGRSLSPYQLASWYRANRFSQRGRSLYAIACPSVCLSSIVCLTLVGPTQAVEFSAIFLRHLVPWPSVDTTENFTEIVPGEALRRRS